MKPTLLVLAAGIGSRYGGLKQIDPVGPSGEIIIDYSIHDAVAAGFGKVVFVIRKDIEEPFKETIGKRFEGKIPVEYVYQELDKIPSWFKIPADRKKPWGTGHAILMGKDAVKEPFAAINADDFYGKSAYKLLGDFLRKASVDAPVAEYCMAGYVLRNTLSEHGTVARGVCKTKNGLLSDVVEMTKIEKNGNKARNKSEDGAAVELTGDEIVSLNIWGFTPSIFGHLEERFSAFLKNRGQDLKAEFFIPTVVNDLIKEGGATVSVLETPDPWYGVTYKEDKPELVKNIGALISKGVYPPKLF